MTVYQWQKQLQQGEAGEKKLDSYFGKWYTVKGATIEQQQKGIDRIFVKPDGTRMTVEYKSDSKAAETGRVFIETMKNLGMGRWGWAWTCQADMLVYWVMPNYLFMIQPIEIRKALPEWMKVYPRKLAQNNNYVTEGYVVPLRDFQKSAKVVRVLDKGL